jgi:hypothetical protein
MKTKPPCQSDDVVYGMWQGERICEILGYVGEHEWDKNSILKYLETLVYVHDKWIESGGFLAEEFDLIEPLDFGSATSPLIRWQAIRDSVFNLATQFPTVEVADIILKLGISIEEFQTAVSVNKNKTIMNESGFRSFSIACLADKPNFAGIGREYSTGVNTMKFYKKLFRTVKEQQGQMIDKE